MDSSSPRSTTGGETGRAREAPSPEPAPQLRGGSPGEVGGVRSALRSDAAQRVAEIEALERGLNSRPASRVHLDLQDVDGAGTRLRLALRGSDLTGSIDLADPRAGQRMRHRVGELHEALARRGLDASALGIRAARGMEARSLPDAEISALVQESLNGLTRLVDSQGGTGGERSGRQGGPKHDAEPESRQNRDLYRRDRSKEDDQ